MKALFVHGHRFKRDKENYYSDGQFSYDLWKNRYLRYFDEIYIASRVVKLNGSSISKNISSGPGVFHIELPDMTKMSNRIFKKGTVSSIIKSLIVKNNIDIVIARLPSSNGLKAIKVAKALNKRIVVEMVGDPFDALWYHGRWEGKVLAPYQFLKYKLALKNMDNIIFVTENYLQSRYKKKHEKYFTTNISNVNVNVDSENYKNNNIKLFEEDAKVVKIAMIGSYTSKYKGIDTAIEMIFKLNEDYKIKTELSILGPGNSEVYNEKINKYKLNKSVNFVGTLPSGEKVLNWLDKHDIYIQPSLTEGLPRGLIEAMSRGLPAVATNVGDIPELLKEEAQVGVKEPGKMARIIYDLITDKEYYINHSNYNFLQAKNYDAEILEKRRDTFYSKILEE